MTFLSDLRQPEVDLFVPLSHDFEQLFRQIASIRVKTPSNTNLVASGLIKRENGSLPVHVRRSKTSLLELPFNAARSWGQFNKTLTNVIYNCSIVLESKNNSYTCKLHL